MLSKVTNTEDSRGTMRLTCARATLCAAVQHVARAATDGHAQPILQQMLLQVTGGTVTLAATDREVAITSELPAPGADDGWVMAPARILQGILEQLPEGDLILTTDDRQGLIITGARVRYTLRGLPATSFPEIPPVTPVTRITVHASLLRGIIRKTQFALPTEGKPVLLGALLHWDGARLTMVATDTRRLALAQATATGPAQHAAMILPARALREMAHLLTGVTEPVVLLSDGLQLAMRLGRTTLSTRLVEDAYPDYARVLPGSQPTRVLLNRRAVLDALCRIEVVARVGVNRVTLALTEDAVTLTARAHDIGHAREEVAAEVDGPAMTVAFNAAFLREALETYEAAAVTLALAGPHAPAVLEDDDGSRCVIMPMHGQ